MGLSDAIGSADLVLKGEAIMIQGVKLQNFNERGNQNQQSNSRCEKTNPDSERGVVLKRLAAELALENQNSVQNQVSEEMKSKGTGHEKVKTAISTVPSRQPFWDEVKRELQFEGQVVKRFKWPAKNQLRVLIAFQEQGWPREIPNPLPISEKVCSKAQLHDTIKCLNRHQVNKLVKFHGNGTGKGVFWTIVEPTGQKPETAI